MNMTKDILNRISNGIKRAYISLVGSDSNQFQTTQINYLGKTADMEVIYPYGLCANPPAGSLVLLFNVQGQEENRAGIANLPNQRFKNLKAGEVVVGNYLTGSYIKLLENGNIEINAAGGDINVTGNINVTGDVKAGAISLGTHRHSGVVPGSGTTSQPV